LWTAAAAQTPQAQAPQEPGIAYDVEIKGAPGGAVQTLIEKTSQLRELKNRRPATAAALARRIRGDEDRFLAILESEGFYAARITSSTEQREDKTQVLVQIEPGPRYLVSRLAFAYVPRATGAVQLSGKADPERVLTGIFGKPARAADVIAAEEAGLEILRANGYPFARRGDRQLEIDHATETISVNLPVFVGREATFGVTQFRGQEDVEEPYLQRLVPWRRGTMFDRSELERFRQRLIRSSLFSTVRVQPAENQDEGEDGAPLDVVVDLQEGPPRTIGARANYSRDVGFGGSVFWQHRNFFGRGENLDLSLDATEILQTAKAGLTKPNWKRLDQTLRFSTVLERSNTEAFRGLSARLLGTVDRRISDHWVIGAGLGAEIARITERGVRRRSLLGSLPITATRFVSDDIDINESALVTDTAIINATRGWRLSVAVTPYVGTYISSVFFLRSEAEGSVYIPLNGPETFVLAARLKLGSIVGSATERVPADRRFYAGGGGSIRGFGYQLVGPVDSLGKPIGGRSLIETSLEARFRVTNTIGLVPFVDAGSVSTSSLPGSGVVMRVAAGLGARYYTGVGPLRVDVAFPINKRRGIDKGFQFYLSFGQAF
jgi:translocation and assembly module TamA